MFRAQYHPQLRGRGAELEWGRKRVGGKIFKYLKKNLRGYNNAAWATAIDRKRNLVKGRKVTKHDIVH